MIKVRRTPQRDSSSPYGVSYLTEMATLAYTYATSGAGLELFVEATADNPIYVREVVHVVETAAAGTSPTVNVGDGTTADLWIDQADVTLNTAGHVVSSQYSATAGGGSNYSNTLRSGKFYTSPFKVVVTKGGTWTAGKGKVIVYFTRL